MDEQISHLLTQVNQVITTVPGIWDTLGAISISEIGDIHRFDALNKLVAFAGLDVKVTQSGEFSGAKQHISSAVRLIFNGLFGLLLREQPSVIPSCQATVNRSK